MRKSKKNSTYSRGRWKRPFFAYQKWGNFSTKLVVFWLWFVINLHAKFWEILATFWVQLEVAFRPKTVLVSCQCSCCPFIMLNQKAINRWRWGISNLLGIGSCKRVGGWWKGDGGWKRKRWGLVGGLQCHTLSETCMKYLLFHFLTKWRFKTNW